MPEDFSLDSHRRIWAHMAIMGETGRYIDLVTLVEELRQSGAQVLTVQAKEGLPIGLAITVRYKLDARRLDYIHNTLPDGINTEVVPPVIGSVFRSIVPRYTVREVFSARREEIRQQAANEIDRS